MSRGTSALVQTLPRTHGETLGALIETTKPRITRMVVITALIGAALAALDGDAPSWGTLLWMLLVVSVGTALSASGANSLNQWMERARDAQMRRTAGRPLPVRAVGPATVFLFGCVLSLAGALLLWMLLGPVPAAVSLSCTLIYVLLYTPMKVYSPWATLVGAIPGALPPLIGWTAIAGSGDFSTVLDPGGLSLVAIMTIWQIPHFLAIAWMYREDYEQGGFRVLPVLDPNGRLTAWTMLITGALLLLASLSPLVAMPEIIGAGYGVIAGATGIAYLILCARLAREKTVAMARRVFIASVIHLPILLLTLVVDALV